MNKKTIMNILKNPTLLFQMLADNGLLTWIPDSVFLKILYRLKLQKKLHLNKPETFNEKLQWLKLHDRNPEYTLMVDKYEAKKYVSDKIGERHIVPTIGVWDSFDQIDFAKLPEQFVLKCTHDSGGLVVCRNKKELDIEDARRKIQKCMRKNFYWTGREWPYKDVKPRIIAEKYMTDSKPEQNNSDRDTGLKDYKFFCFNGRVKFFKIDFDRFIKHRANYYDTDGQLLPFGEASYPPNPDMYLIIPGELHEMIAYAEKLSAGIPFVRVDFYNVSGHVYFGEITFYPASGFGRFTPPEWDAILGTLIKLPNKITEK